jgi:eukaryotic-like serine/threonine-protein kinase
VIETRPTARSQLDIGRTVTLVISRGRPKVKVPDVTGLKVDEARTRLENIELQVQTRDQESADKEPGTVLAQDPLPDEKIQKGQVVTLTIAKEPASAEVPDVVDAELNDALDALSGAGFKPRTENVTVVDPAQDGFVIAQKPKAGSKKKKGTVVTIQVGKFEPAAPEGTPTPTETPTPSPTP